MVFPVQRKKYPHVAVWANKGRGYGRGVLKGIAEYVEIYGPWSMFVDYRGPQEFESWLKQWRGDGLIAYVADDDVAEKIAGLKIAAVDLLGHRPGLGLPQVGNDDRAIGCLAADHLLERKFRHFGFSGYHDQSWSKVRGEAFIRRVSKTALSFQTFHCSWPRTLPDWEKVEEEMSRWLEQLPKPAGLLACSDHNAQLILDACHRAGIAVPEEIAVIGVDNDEETCRFCDPPLTSIIANTQKIGFEAAHILAQIMSGRARAGEVKPILIPPLGIATRRSTDITAIDDALVGNAVRYIREHACDGISVMELPKVFGTSRSVLYRRFQNAIGRSPHHEILRVQLERVKNLLAQTDLSIEKIAEMAGFEHAEYMSVAFKREIGTSPGLYRRSQKAAALK